MHDPRRLPLLVLACMKRSGMSQVISSIKRSPFSTCHMVQTKNKTSDSVFWQGFLRIETLGVYHQLQCASDWMCSLYGVSGEQEGTDRYEFCKNDERGRPLRHWIGSRDLISVIWVEYILICMRSRKAKRTAIAVVRWPSSVLMKADGGGVKGETLTRNYELLGQPASRIVLNIFGVFLFGSSSKAHLCHRPLTVQAAAAPQFSLTTWFVLGSLWCIACQIVFVCPDNIIFGEINKPTITIIYDQVEISRRSAAV